MIRIISVEYVLNYSKFLHINRNQKNKKAQTSEQGHVSLSSTIEPSNFEEARNDLWINSMEE